MNEDKRSYILRSIWDAAESTRADEDSGKFLSQYDILLLFYDIGLLTKEEYGEIFDYFKENDRVFESIMNKTADLDALHQQAVDNVESYLYGGTCASSIDGIIQWIKSPDCSKRALVKLKEEIDKTLA